MKDEQNKATIMQWLVPTIVLMIVVIAMLINFSVKSSLSVKSEVENLFINIAEDNAAKVKYEVVRMTDAGKPVGTLMKKYVEADPDNIIEMAEALRNNTDAYAVIYCSSTDGSGLGVLHDGTEVDISKTEYYSQISQEGQSNEKEGKTSENATVKYIYAKDDGLETGREAIIASIPVIIKDDVDRLLMYYSVENLQMLFSKAEFDSDSFYAIIDPEGMIIEAVGSDSNYTIGENLWDTVKQEPGHEHEIAKAMVRMKNKTCGSLEAELKGEKRTLVYVPVGLNNWTLVVGINQSYVDNLEKKEWATTKQILDQLIVAILIFLGLVVAINIISRIKSSEKSKELEEKADTDLLTSLNNKLATERKIKEYIEKNPQEQALMFVLDIDNFKKINDTLGHAFGDEVLRSLGHQIGAVFRATDVIGRTGGDEFTIFLKHLNDDTVLEKEAKKLCDFFKNFQAGEYVKYAATASIGAAVFPRDGKDFESLYKAADNALYTAKKRGKSQLAFYGDENEKSEGKKKVEAESRKND